MTDQQIKRYSPNWGGLRKNSGRRKLNMSVREGQTWQLAEPVQIGAELVQSEMLKKIIDLVVSKVTRDEIVLVNDKGLTFTLTRKEVQDGNQSSDPDQTTEGV